MRLLILTQKVDLNDDNLGSFHGWIREFSRHCEKITVVGLAKGEYDLPGNVSVFSLGKAGGSANNFQKREIFSGEENFTRQRLFARCRYAWKFYEIVWRERKNYDAVFVHMNTEYVVLGGLFWRIFGKKIAMWYAHGHINFSLRLAEKLAHIIFTSSRSGCRLESKKIRIVGQGVDIEKFKIKSKKLKVVGEAFKIISTGRISPSKDYETLIKAMEILAKEEANVSARIIGGPAMPKDEQYFKNLKATVKDKGLDGVIEFFGPVPYKEIPAHLCDADLFVNLSQTGSLDRSVLEAMACGLPVLTSNEAYKDIVSGFGFFVQKGDFRELAGKIKDLMGLGREERESIGQKLRQIVKHGHLLENLITKIVDYLK